MIIKNYSGDIMNFDMAKDLAEMENIEVRSVVVDDDVAVENSLYTQGRRGVAGTVFVHKVLGALAADGADLATLEATAQELVGNIHSIGVGLSGGTVPEVGEPGFTLAEDEIEFGIGIHGEPGYRREKLAPSKAMAVELVDKLLASFEWTAGDKIAVMVNGMGATPLMEQYIFMNDVLDYLEQEVPDVTVAYRKVGNYMTSLEMAGLSLTFFKLTNDDYLTALKRPVDTVGWDN
jgi:dihydroxyacetone kinase-like protein